MSINQPDRDRMPPEFMASLRDYWVFFLIEGIILVALGLAAITIPAVATLAIALFLGWLFLVSGVVGLATTFWMRHAPGFWWSLLSAVLAIVTGVLLIGWPTTGAVSLTLVLTVFFVVEGIASIMLAIQHRQRLSGRWGWLLASGIVDIILAGLLLIGLPGTASWALGLLVGINMLFGGASLIAMALYARAEQPGTAPRPARMSV